MNELLKVENLCVWYHNKNKDINKNAKNFIVDDKSKEHIHILKDFSFSIEEGEIFGLKGKSGCGKTTVVWSIMSMIESMGGHVSGKITYDDQSILDGIYIPEAKKLWWKEIAIVPQASMSAFNPCITIGDTLKETVLAHNKKATNEQINEKSFELMDIVRLDKKVLHYYPHEMSGGMKQRAAIAASLILDPRFLILDEATTGLDVLVEADILKTIKEIQIKNNMTILMISHDKRITNAMCHRSINMDEVAKRRDGIKS